MKILQKLMQNKIGISLVIAHWIFILIAFWNGRFEESLALFLAVMIAICDLPALLVAGFLWSPLYLFPEDTSIFFYGFFITSIFAITFQWLFVGQSIYNTFSRKGSKLTSLSLTDE